LSELASDVQTTDDSLGWAEAEVSVEAGEGVEGAGAMPLLPTLTSTRAASLEEEEEAAAAETLTHYAEDFEEYDDDDCDVNLVTPRQQQVCACGNVCLRVDGMQGLSSLFRWVVRNVPVA
jgi:hypothetical protein